MRPSEDHPAPGRQLPDLPSARRSGKGDTVSIPGLRQDCPGESVRADEELAVGERVGRYLILSRIGAGGMGVVYAAYDPALDRKVAIKLLLPRASASKAEQELLHGEARALARLQHGNVVSIYDVGEHEGRFFIAMELVDGHTLSEWLAAGRRPWSAVVEVFIEAARGLQAAHEVSLLHRDFKPSNVMIGDDGSVRVTDFGLAHLHQRSGNVTGKAEQPSEASLWGTPGFMAPEILAGGPGDPRSDQYSFCVAMSRLLLGAMPDASDGETIGRRPSSPPGIVGRPPRSLNRVLKRGMAKDPGDRYPSMDELLIALSPIPRRKRRLLQSVIGIAGALQALIWIFARQGTGETCQDRSIFPADVWGRERAVVLKNRFLAAKPQGGERAARHVIAALDSYSGSWSDARLDVCRATAEKVQSARLYDLRMDCLDQRLSELRAVVDVLLVADPETVDRSIDLALGIQGLGRCSNRIELSNIELPALDPAKKAEVRALRQDIERAFVDLRMVEAVDLAGGAELLERARELGYPPTEARALELVARQVWAGAGLDEASRRMIEALAAALALGDRPMQARLFSYLAQIHLYSGAGFAQARIWEQLADAALVPLPEASREVRIEVEQGLSLVDYEMGDLPGAERRLRRALALGTVSWGPNSPRLRRILSSLAASLGDSETMREETVRLLRRSLAIGQVMLGSDNPLLIPDWVTLSHGLLLGGDYEEAERLARHALRIASGSNHYVRSALPPLMLAEVLVARDRPEEALPFLDTALELARETFGDAHRVPIEVRYTRGFAELLLLRIASARASFESARELAELLPEGHWSKRLPLLGLGYVELASGREGLALEIFEGLAGGETSDDQALAPWAKVMLYGGLGQSLLPFGRPEEARQHLERAIREEPAGGDPLLLARPRFALARLVIDGDREAALDLAADALDGLSGARSPACLQLRSEVDAWVRAHQDDPRSAFSTSRAFPAPAPRRPALPQTTPSGGGGARAGAGARSG